MSVSNDPSACIEVQSLWKVFGEDPDRVFEPEYADKSRAEIQDELGLVVGLRDVSFSVDVGQVFVVMGLSGSGKSTLVRCLIRLIEPTRGHVLFDGDDILPYSPEDLREFRRNKLAMVFQHYSLLPHRRVMDNVAYGLEIQGMEREERYEAASKAIQTVGLDGWEDYYPREMSGGMQQRVGLARALAVDPDVLLMDEPFSGLDPLIRREMQDELITLQTEQHRTIVFITHDLDEALKLGDRIVIMRDGEIAQAGAPEEIVTAPADDYIAEFVQDVSMSKVIRARAIMETPAASVSETDSPSAALDAIRGAGGASAFLLGGGDRALVGELTLARARTLAERGADDLTDAGAEPARTVSPRAFIEDIIPMAASSERPIAVTDENGNLLGEIHRGALLAGMATRARES